MLRVGSTLLTTLSAFQGVRITSSCPTPRARGQACVGRVLIFFSCFPPASLCANEFMHTLKPKDAPYGVWPRPAVLSSTVARAPTSSLVQDDSPSSLPLACPRPFPSMGATIAAFVLVGGVLPWFSACAPPSPPRAPRLRVVLAQPALGTSMPPTSSTFSGSLRLRLSGASGSSSCPVGNCGGSTIVTTFPLFASGLPPVPIGGVATS